MNHPTSKVQTLVHLVETRNQAQHPGLVSNMSAKANQEQQSYPVSLKSFRCKWAKQSKSAVLSLLTQYLKHLLHHCNSNIITAAIIYGTGKGLHI